MADGAGSADRTPSLTKHRRRACGGVFYLTSRDDGASHRDGSDDRTSPEAVAAGDIPSHSVAAAVPTGSGGIHPSGSHASHDRRHSQLSRSARRPLSRQRGLALLLPKIQPGHQAKQRWQTRTISFLVVLYPSPLQAGFKTQADEHGLNQKRRFDGEIESGRDCMPGVRAFFHRIITFHEGGQACPENTYRLSWASREFHERRLHQEYHLP